MRERGVVLAVRHGVLCFAVCLTTALAVAGGARAQRYEPTLASLDRHVLPRWWQDAKFGIFIHWGPYSVPAFAVPRSTIPFVLAEWYWQNQQLPGSPAYFYHLRTYGANFVYDDFIPRFTAARYDPASWVRLFKAAGAKYFMLTVKHHDGVALWPTRTTHRNTFDLGPHRDLVAPLFRAARRIGGIKPGIYYSIPEFFNPAPRPPDSFVTDGNLPYTLINPIVFDSAVFPARNAYTEQPVPYTGYIPISDYAAGQVRPQLRELIRRYHPWEIWCDIGGSESYFRSNEVIADYYNWTRRTNPGGVVVNDRCGDSRTHHDFATVEEGATYSVGRRDPHVRTETVRTMGGSWGYNAQETAADYSSVADLVHELVTVVAENSNFVLNVGPRADGTIPEVMQQRLLGIGRWLRINGQAIYGTRPWTQSSDGNLRFTVGKHAFYITALVWPGKTLVTTAPVPLTRRSRITLLGSDGRPLSYRRNDAQLTVTMPDHGDQRAATRSRDAFVLRIAR